MAGQGFKPHIKLVLEPGNAARLVDDANKRTLVLTVSEGQVFALMTADSTAETLAFAAQGAGLDIDLRQVEALLARAHANGFIEDAGPKKAAADSPPLKLEDIAPAFRTDLIFGVGSRPGLASLKDPESDQAVSLHDFEVHVARMLDGKHTVQDVITSAGKIGVVLTPESLRTFVAQMRGYGLMLEWWSPPSKADVSTWPARDKWNPDVRELYQSALRLFRQGRPQHALEYLEMLLEVQPATPEALELKERVKAKLAGGAENDLTFEALHGPDDPLPSLTPMPGAMAAVGKKPQAAVPPGLQPSKSAPQPPPRPQPESVTAPAAAPVPPKAPSRPTLPEEPIPIEFTEPSIEAFVPEPEPAPFLPTAQDVEVVVPAAVTSPSQPAAQLPVEEKPEPKKRKKKSRVGLMLFVLLLLGLAVPVPALKTIACEVKPIAIADVTVRGGTFHTLLAKPGAHVDSGGPLASLDTDKANAEKQQLEKDIARLEAAAQKAQEKAKPAALTKAKAALAKAEKELAKATPARKAAKERALEKAQKAFDEANGGERAETLLADVVAAKAKRVDLQKQIDGALVTAPVAGAFEPVALPPSGAQFDDGTLLGHMVDEHHATVVGAPDDAKSLILTDKRIDISTLKRTPEGLELAFDAERPPHVDVEVASGWAPWPLRYWPLARPYLELVRSKL